MASTSWRQHRSGGRRRADLLCDTPDLWNTHSSMSFFHGDHFRPKKCTFIPNPLSSKVHSHPTNHFIQVLIQTRSHPGRLKKNILVSPFRGPPLRATKIDVLQKKVQHQTSFGPLVLTRLLFQNKKSEPHSLVAVGLCAFFLLNVATRFKPVGVQGLGLFRVWGLRVLGVCEFEGLGVLVVSELLVSWF